MGVWAFAMTNPHYGPAQCRRNRRKHLFPVFFPWKSFASLFSSSLLRVWLLTSLSLSVDWNFPGSLKEQVGTSPTFSLSSFHNKTKLPASCWKEHIHTYSAPTFMAAIRRNGPQITLLKGLGIREFYSAIAKKETVVRWMCKHSLWGHVHG